MSKTIQEVKDNLELSKQRTQALIDQANATTGKTDTDLTSAVGALVEGFGQGGSEDTLIDAIITRTITDITSELTEIGDYAFCNCTSLTSASFPNATEIGSFVFSSCTNLTEVSLPNVGGII